eukprot:3934484-Rhodomonas_salina.2
MRLTCVNASPRQRQPRTPAHRPCRRAARARHEQSSAESREQSAERRAPSARCTLRDTVIAQRSTDRHRTRPPQHIRAQTRDTARHDHSITAQAETGPAYPCGRRSRPGRRRSACLTALSEAPEDPTAQPFVSATMRGTISAGCDDPQTEAAAQMVCLLGLRQLGDGVSAGKDDVGEGGIGEVR